MSLAKIQRKRLALLVEYDNFLLERSFCAQSLDSSYELSKKEGLTDEVKENLAALHQRRQLRMSEVKANLNIVQRKLKYYKRMYKTKCREKSLANR